jgi:hypothetical protein
MSDECSWDLLALWKEASQYDRPAYPKAFSTEIGFCHGSVHSDWLTANEDDWLNLLLRMRNETGCSRTILLLLDCF